MLDGIACLVVGFHGGWGWAKEVRVISDEMMLLRSSEPFA